MRSGRALLLLLLSVSTFAIAASGAGGLVARQITAATAATDLFSGSDATGGLGDWYLSNGVVQAVVDDVGFQTDRYQSAHELVPIQNGIAPTGGTLIDLGLVGQNDDQLTSVYPLVNLDPSIVVYNAPASYVLGQPALPSIVAAVDDTAGIASLTVYGFVRLGPNPTALTIETQYSLRSGENFLRIRSTLRNAGSVALPVSRVGDAVVVGVGQLIPYIPSPGRGFTIATGFAQVLYQPLSGRLTANDGIADTDAMLSCGEVSYGFMAENGILVESGDARVLSVSGPPLGGALQPGASTKYERRIYVSGRNDAASITDLTLPELTRRYGIPMGRVQGRLQSPEGHPFRASIQVLEDDLVPGTPAADTLLSAATGDHSPLPITQIAAGSSSGGSFQAVVPVGRNELRITVEGRDPIGPLSFDVQANQTTDLGTIALSDTGSLSVRVTDADSGLAVPARITLKGIDVPDPMLGDPVDLVINGTPNRVGRKLSSPFANVLFTANGSGDLALRPGRYRVIASHGTEFDMAYGDVQVTAGQTSSIALAVRRAVDAGAWLAADFHIHAAPSADSSVPPEERVRDYAAEGIQVMVSADHDFIFDYAPLIARMGLGGVVTSMVGAEVTTSQTFGIYVGGVGHMNAWPLVPKPQVRKNGAPEDELCEPAVIYDRVRAQGAQVVQMNHPFSQGQGYLGAIHFDAALPLASPPNDALLRTSSLGTGTRNVDFDALEIYNGLNQNQNDLARNAWFNLLNQGIHAIATANSDSHDVSAIGPGLAPGLPRTYVASAGGVAGFDPATFDANLKAGKAFGTSGPLLAVEADWSGAPAGPGDTIHVSGCCLSIHAHVQAPCWVPVGEVRFYANGALAATDPAPTSCDPRNRFDGSLAVAPTIDTHYVVIVDEVVPRPPPTSFTQQLSLIVYPVVRFQAFSNPIFVDVDGNGRFDPPGVPAP